MKKLKNGQAIYSDSTLMKWNKRELIRHIRCLENNLEAEAEFLNNQAEYIKYLQSATDDSVNMEDDNA